MSGLSEKRRKRKSRIHQPACVIRTCRITCRTNSLDAQKSRMKAFAEYNDHEIAGEYEDAWQIWLVHRGGQMERRFYYGYRLEKGRFDSNSYFRRMRRQKREGIHMGNDAFVHISKKSCSKKMVEKLLGMMDYKKYGEIFYCGNDEEYKYYSGIKVWQCDESENEVVYRVRTQASASGYDIQKQNDTIRCLKKYCMGYFESDVGKNRYFEIGRLVKGAESGCYFAIQNLDNSFSLLCHSLSQYPEDQEGERGILELAGIPTPSIFNANVYLAYLCSVIEEYFRSTYISLLKYSEKKEKILNMKFSPYDMVDIM